MAKRSKQQKLTTSLIAEFIVLDMDFNSGKISEESLRLLVQRLSILAIAHLDEKYHAEFSKFEAVKRLRELYYFD
jgi:hypothetical protein